MARLSAHALMKMSPGLHIGQIVLTAGDGTSELMFYAHHDRDPPPKRCGFGPDPEAAALHLLRQIREDAA